MRGLGLLTTVVVSYMVWVSLGFQRAEGIRRGPGHRLFWVFLLPVLGPLAPLPLLVGFQDTWRHWPAFHTPGSLGVRATLFGCGSGCVPAPLLAASGPPSSVSPLPFLPGTEFEYTDSESEVKVRRPPPATLLRPKKAPGEPGAPLATPAPCARGPSSPDKAKLAADKGRKARKLRGPKEPGFEAGPEASDDDLWTRRRSERIFLHDASAAASAPAPSSSTPTPAKAGRCARGPPSPRKDGGRARDRKDPRKVGSWGSGTELGWLCSLRWASESVSQSRKGASPPSRFLMEGFAPLHPVLQHLKLCVNGRLRQEDLRCKPNLGISVIQNFKNTRGTGDMVWQPWVPPPVPQEEKTTKKDV